MATETWTPGAGAWTNPERRQSSKGATRGHLYSRPKRWFGYPEKKVAEEMEHLWGLQWPVRQGPW